MGSANEMPKNKCEFNRHLINLSLFLSVVALGLLSLIYFFSLGGEAFPDANGPIRTYSSITSLLLFILGGEISSVTPDWLRKKMENKVCQEIEYED